MNKKPLGCLPMIGVAFFLFIFLSILNSFSNTESPCAKNWEQCADKENIVNNYKGMTDIKVACQSSARKLAKYGEPDFSVYPFGTFYNEDPFLKNKTITLLEPNAKFQNMYGAMENVAVRCVYDLNKKTVLKTYIVDR